MGNSIDNQTHDRLTPSFTVRVFLPFVIAAVAVGAIPVYRVGWISSYGFGLTTGMCICSFAFLVSGFFARGRDRACSVDDRRASEEKYRGLFEVSGDAIVLFDENGFFDCNEAALKLFGYRTQADFFAKHPPDISPATQPGGFDSRALAESRIAVAAETGSNRFEWIHRRLDGTEFPAEVLLNPFWYKGKQVFHAAVRDISERKRIEEQYRLLAEQVNDVIWSADLHWNWSYVSPSVKRFCGFSVEEAMQLPIDTVVTPSSLQLTREHVGRAIAEALDNPGAMGKPLVLELEHKCKDGSTVWAEVNATLVPGEDGRPVRWVGVTRDITARREIESQLACAKEVAEAADRAKSEFLANMSHELRTPMTAILGFAGLLQDERSAGRISPSGADAVATIVSNGEHLLSVLNEILDLSKIEAGEFAVERAECSTSQLVADVMSLMAVRASDKGLRLEADCIGPTPEVISTDAGRLRQILVNLVGNAVKFTKSGEVRVTTRLLNAPKQKPKLEISVSDTGCGLSADATKRLFTPFMQADSSTSRQYGGTGLGLAISRRLARLLGGDITVSSELGQGSTFRLTADTGPLDNVPLRECSSVTDQPVQTQDRREPNRTLSLKGIILLVEDGRDNQRLISYLVERAGAEVEVVENGRHACEKTLAAVADGTPYDLVLMDMQMPVMDGYEATRVLRDAGYTAPIIALTAHAMVGDEQSCLDAGCDAYLTKPIDRNVFLPSLANFLPSAAQSE